MLLCAALAFCCRSRAALSVGAAFPSNAVCCCVASVVAADNPPFPMPVSALGSHGGGGGGGGGGGSGGRRPGGGGAPSNVRGLGGMHVFLFRRARKEITALTQTRVRCCIVGRRPSHAIDHVLT
jgi:hypothetical protein